MKNSSISLPIAVIAGSLIFGLTTGLSAKDFGYYLHGGVTYWDGFDAPSLEDEIGLVDVSIDYELVDSRAQLSLGLGLHVNEQWSFEGLYVSTPERTISGINWMFPPLMPDGDPITLSWSAKIKQTVGAVSAIYDLYINENLSIFGKGGIAFVRHDSSQTITVDDMPGASFGNVVPSSLIEAEENTQEFYGAIGARIPIRQGDACLTFSYQFFETSDDPETSFEIGFQWNL